MLAMHAGPADLMKWDDWEMMDAFVFLCPSSFEGTLTTYARDIITLAFTLGIWDLGVIAWMRVRVYVLLNRLREKHF